MKPSSDIKTLIAIMAALRTPKTGCPWDLEQTFATIAPYTIEEAYEVADAIARNDLLDLKDELGDLLLQVVYHARMAEEQNAFEFDDVVQSVSEKMIRRHPHVFGGATAAAASDVNVIWDKIKAEEKAAAADDKPVALLAGVPLALPGLTRAIKLQSKAAKAGFDWPNIGPVFAKLKEEIAEFEEVARPHDPRGANAPADDPAIAQQSMSEFGDMLFVMANIARHLQIDPEAALRTANEKFIRRFSHIESRLAERGSAPEKSTLEEMDSLWDEAKFLEQFESDT